MFIEKVEIKQKIKVYEDKSGSGVMFEDFIRTPLGVVSSTSINEFNKKIKDAGFINIRYNTDILVAMANHLLISVLYNSEDNGIQSIYYHPKYKYWLVKRTFKDILKNDLPEIQDMFRPYSEEDDD